MLFLQIKMDAYNADVREACKYGSKCYQTNPAHTDRFKHLPKTDGKKSFIKKC